MVYELDGAGFKASFADRPEVRSACGVRDMACVALEVVRGCCRVCRVWFDGRLCDRMYAWAV